LSFPYSFPSHSQPSPTHNPSKLKMRTSSLIPLLLALLPLSNAATCTSPNQVLLVSGPDPIQMMWSIRAVACNGDNWWKSLKITSNDGPYGAEAFTRNMVSQQNCWVRLPPPSPPPILPPKQRLIIEGTGFNRANHNPMHGRSTGQPMA
jgi:hypothetical protein